MSDSLSLACIPSSSLATTSVALLEIRLEIWIWILIGKYVAYSTEISFLLSCISISYEKRISQRESRRINSSIAAATFTVICPVATAGATHPPIWLLWPPCGALLPACLPLPLPLPASLSVPTDNPNGPSNGGRQQLSTVAHALSLSVNVGGEGGVGRCTQHGPAAIPGSAIPVSIFYIKLHIFWRMALQLVCKLLAAR